MADDTQLLYLEPDDEITTVVRRLREADAPRVVLVASGRTKATTSAVALRLLAQVAAEEGREVILVADAAARSLAADAGLPAFASVAEANAEGASPVPAPPPASAPIHVVRGEPVPATVDEPLATLPPLDVAPARGLEETQAVPVAPRPSGQRPGTQVPPHRAGPRRPGTNARGVPRVALGVIVALLVAMGAGIATVLPAASITIQRRPIDIGPFEYSVTPQVHESDGTAYTSTMSGEATGHRTRRTAATGNVLLINYSDSDVLVPAGTVVSAGGEILFQTTQTVTVPDSFFGFVGTAVSTIEAIEPGLSGNVAADAIDRIEDKDVDRALRGQGQDQRRIRNDDATEGGDEQELVFVKGEDVNQLKAEIRADLQRQFDDAQGDGGDRLYAGQAPKPRVTVPEDLVGQVSEEEQLTFELTGRLVDRRPYVLASDAKDAATEMLLGDDGAVPEGATLDESTVQVELGDPALDGEALTVPASVTAAAARDVDEDVLRTELAGMTAEDAEAALGEFGPSTVELWPGWVDRVPRLGWRVTFDVQAADSSS